MVYFPAIYTWGNSVLDLPHCLSCTPSFYGKRVFTPRKEIAHNRAEANLWTKEAKVFLSELIPMQVTPTDMGCKTILTHLPLMQIHIALRDEGGKNIYAAVFFPLSPPPSVSSAASINMLISGVMTLLFHKTWGSLDKFFN